MFRSLRLALVSLVFVMVALSAAATALAAPVAWKSVDVTLHSEQNGGILLVSGVLPDKTALPADAEFSVPKGSQLQWIGEILGGPPSADPELTFKKTTSNEYDLYRFTLTKARAAQIEVLAPKAAILGGTTYSPSFTWTPSRNMPEVRLSVRVPKGAQIVQPAQGAALESGSDGYALYTKTLKKVKAGDQLDFAVGYTVPAAPASPATSGPDSATIFVMFALAIVLAGSVVFLLRRRGETDASVDETQSGARCAASNVAATKTQSTTTKSASGAKKRASGEPASDDEPPPGGTQGLSGSAKRNLVTAAVIGLLLIAVVVAGGQATKTKIVGDTISETFSQGEPCQRATVPLSIPDGADRLGTSEKLFGALRPLGGMNTATLNFATSSIDVGFCESKLTEAAVRQALMPTGLIGAATEEPAVLE